MVTGATYSRVVLLLVGLVGTLRVADLGLEVLDVLEDVVAVPCQLLVTQRR